MGAVRRDWSKTDARAAIGVTLDDVIVAGLPVPAWLRHVAVQHAVQLQDRALGKRHLLAALMDQTEGIAIACHLLFGTALRRGILEHQ